MKAPALAAVTERRILVSYRVDPDLPGSHLPAPFRPALAGGHGVAGICLIRPGRIRPAGLPAAGLRPESAARRVAVCPDGPGGPVTGVCIPPARHLLPAGRAGRRPPVRRLPAPGPVPGA
jgi:hypothetical protein